MRVCVLSGGGDAPGVNAVVRGFVHAAHRLTIDVVGARYGFEGLLAADGIVPITLETVRGVLPKGGYVLGCSTRINPFFATPVATGESGAGDFGSAIVDRLRSLGIDALVLIGGDGTMLAAERFAKLGFPCLGIPKTIDNDLADTDITCGFESAVETATRAVDALHATAEAHARVMIVEVMGRNAGFIALHAGIAGGADVVLLPEIPYRLPHVIAKIKEREALGLRFSIVVVAEGAAPVGRDELFVEAGKPGILPRLGGAGQRLLHQLEAARLDHDIRLTVLGHLQRGGSPSAIDRLLGSELGVYAAELCERRELGRRIVVRAGQLSTILLGRPERNDTHKHVDPSGRLAHTARLLGIELGDGRA
jgi:6-phosphofructokinase 1